jgi:hypothetical protein
MHLHVSFETHQRAWESYNERGGMRAQIAALSVFTWPHCLFCHVLGLHLKATGHQSALHDRGWGLFMCIVQMVAVPELLV